MVNVSAEFMETIEERTDFMVSADITFTDGTELSLSGDAFSLSNNSLSDSAGLSGFPLGVAVEKVIQIEIFNEDDQYYAYDFYGAQIRLRLSLQLSETTETIDYGTYTVITPETYGTTIIVQAADDMYKADDEYESQLEYPATLREIVQDVCSTTGIYLLTTTFKNDQFVVDEKPDNITFRQVIAMAAMIACGYARMDFQGRLRITSYSTSMFDVTAGLDGGIFDYPDDSSVDLTGAEFDNNNPDVYTSGPDADGGSFNPWNDAGDYNGGNDSASHYQTGDTASGGFFNPWNNDEDIDGGSFEEMRDYHVLYNFTNGGLKLETDDVVITGIQTVDDSGDDETVYLVGEEGYVLQIENDLIYGKEEEAISLIGEALIGLKFRPFEGEHIAYPIAEYGDIALVCDRKYKAYPTILTDIDFVFRGYTDFKCSAESPIRNSSTYYGNSDYVKAVVAARKNTAIQISAYDQAVQMLTNLMANSMGVFKTEVVLDDGSTIFYLHDKPTLAESMTIWEMTADAFAVSTDGGKTWNAGMDSEGNVLVNVLSAIGINFDWAHGGTLTLGGYDNINGQMRILNSSGSQVGFWDMDGIVATSGKIGGWTITSTKIYGGGTTSNGGDGNYSKVAVMQLPRDSITWVLAVGGTSHSSYATCPFRVDKDGNMYAESGTFGGKLDAATGSFSGSLSAATGTFSGNLSAAGGTFTGTLNGVDGTFKGSLSAATGTFSGSLSAATGTFKGSLSAASGTFTGSITNTSGSYITKIDSGRIYFYYGSSNLAGYISGASRSSGGYGLTIAGYGHITFAAGSIGVSESGYVSPGSGGSRYVGRTGSLTVMTSSSSSTTLHFQQGICVS